MYGPKSGSLIASMPGLPFGLPGPGFPIPPVPPPPPLASFWPDPEPAPVGAREGPGVYFPPPEPFPVEEPPLPPPFTAVPEPLIGPVAYRPPVVPPEGTGTWNAELGLATGFGVRGGFIEGRAVGGCGFACWGAFGAAG